MFTDNYDLLDCESENKELQLVVIPHQITLSLHLNVLLLALYDYIHTKSCLMTITFKDFYVTHN